MNRKLMTIAAIGIAFAGLGTTDTVLAQAAARTPRMGIAQTAPARGMRQAPGTMRRGAMPGARGQFAPNGILPQGPKNGLQKGPKNGPKDGLQKESKKGPKNGLQKGPKNGPKNGLQKGPKNGPKNGLQKVPRKGPKKGLQKGPKNGPNNGLKQGPRQGFRQGPQAQRGPRQGLQRGPGNAGPAVRGRGRR